MKNKILLMFSLAIVSATVAAMPLDGMTFSADLSFGNVQPNQIKGLKGKLATGSAARLQAASSERIVGDADLKTVVSEDFSKFTAGSEYAPDVKQLADERTGKIPDSYLNGSNLVAYPIYQAGGAAFICPYQYQSSTYPGLIYAQNIDASGGLIVSFRAKSTVGGGQIVFQYNYEDLENEEVYAVEEDRMVSLSTEWQTFEFELSAFSDAKPYVLWATEEGGFLIDDIKIQAIVPKIAAPKAMGYTNYTGTSFTANWAAVADATSYLLTVYANDGGTRLFVLSEKEVEGTSFEVAELDVENVYYYYVQAKNDRYTSAYSNTIEVNTVLVPVFNQPTVAADGFVASWNASPRANAYDFWAYRNVETKTGETVVLADTHFNEITSEGTVDKPETTDLSSTTLYFLPGWTLYSPVYIDGAVGTNNLFGLAERNPTYLKSPDFDLTMSGGKVKVDIDIYSTDISGIALFNNVEGKYVNVDEYDISEPLPGEAKWRTHSVELKGGSERSCIAVYGSGYRFTYFDNLKVSMTVQKDGSMLIPISNTVTQETSVKVNADMSVGNTYAYKVRAAHLGTSVDDVSAIGDFSELQYVKGKGGLVNRVAFDGVAAYVVGGKLRVVNPDGLPVAVYSANGSLVSMLADAEVALPSRGVYIVKVGSKVFKVVK